MMRKALIVGAVLAAVATNTQADGGYYKLEGGLIYYPIWQDGLWYQKPHPHDLDLVSYNLGIGAGTRRGAWSYEVTYRYMSSGSVFSFYESDATYEAGGGGPTVGFGHSKWKFHGIELAALYDVTDDWCVKVGYFGFEGIWKTEHVDLIDRIGAKDNWNVRRTRSTPTIGTCYALTDRVAIEATYFVNLAMSHGAGVNDAVTLNLVSRF